MVSTRRSGVPKVEKTSEVEVKENVKAKAKSAPRRSARSTRGKKRLVEAETDEDEGEDEADEEYEDEEEDEDEPKGEGSGEQEEAPMTEFERARLANIAANADLLRSLNLPDVKLAFNTDLQKASSKTPAKASSSSSSTPRTRTPRLPKASASTPSIQPIRRSARNTSSHLQAQEGMSKEQADAESHKRKREMDELEEKEEREEKRRRIEERRGVRRVKGGMVKGRRVEVEEQDESDDDNVNKNKDENGNGNGNGIKREEGERTKLLKELLRELVRVVREKGNQGKKEETTTLVGSSNSTKHDDDNGSKINKAKLPVAPPTPTRSSPVLPSGDSEHESDRPGVSSGTALNKTPKPSRDHLPTPPLTSSPTMGEAILLDDEDEEDNKGDDDNANDDDKQEKEEKEKKATNKAPIKLFPIFNKVPKHALKGVGGDGSGSETPSSNSGEKAENKKGKVDIKMNGKAKDEKESKAIAKRKGSDLVTPKPKTKEAVKASDSKPELKTQSKAKGKAKAKTPPSDSDSDSNLPLSSFLPSKSTFNRRTIITPPSSLPVKSLESLQKIYGHGEVGLLSQKKVVPERVYSVWVHPESGRIGGVNGANGCEGGGNDVVFVGDKLGYLGVWKVPSNPSEGDEDNEGESWVFDMHEYKNSISDIKGWGAHQLITGGYDCTLRSLNFETGTSTELLDLAHLNGDGKDIDKTENQLVSGFDITERGHGNEIWVSDNYGGITCYDARTPPKQAKRWDVTDKHKKVGCISLNQAVDGGRRLAVTGSITREMKIWDLRQLSKALPFEHDLTDEVEDSAKTTNEHGLSCTSAFWNYDGDKILSTSYDDTVRVWHASPHSLVSRSPPERLPKPLSASHDNQTGQWVSVFKARWSPLPSHIAHPHFFVGNMKRKLDVYAPVESGNGGGRIEKIGMLDDSIWGGQNRITAVPAVVAGHPAIPGRVFGANASGKVMLFGRKAGKKAPEDGDNEDQGDGNIEG